MSTQVQNILINPTTDAKTSNSFTGISGTTLTVTAFNLGNTETVTFQIYDPSTQTWANYKADNKIFQLSSQTNGLDVYMTSGIYRMAKTATSQAVGVGVTSNIALNIIAV